MFSHNPGSIADEATTAGGIAVQCGAITTSSLSDDQSESTSIYIHIFRDIHCGIIRGFISPRCSYSTICHDNDLKTSYVQIIYITTYVNIPTWIILNIESANHQSKIKQNDYTNRNQVVSSVVFLPFRHT